MKKKSENLETELNALDRWYKKEVKHIKQMNDVFLFDAEGTDDEDMMYEFVSLRYDSKLSKLDDEYARRKHKIYEKYLFKEKTKNEHE